MIIIRDVDARACFAIANRICSDIRATPFRTREAIVPTTISIGIAMREKGDAFSTEELLERSDKALYQSKENGRNRATFATE
jgi:diguanylate cyclase (GGDEF)-like protein